MVNLPSSGRPDTNTSNRRQQPIIIPIDDPRNNRAFRLAHPYVIFEGYSKPRVPKINHLHPVHKHKPAVRTSKPIQHNGHHASHPPAGHAPLGLESDLDEAYEQDLSEGSGHSDKDEGFLFHEIAAESFTLHDDDDVHSGTGTDTLRPTEGVQVLDDVNKIDPPSNLNVSGLTLVTQNNSTDGVPTYMATLAFDADTAENEYEVRIVKL